MRPDPVGTDPAPPRGPRLSVLMANHDGARFLAEAIRTVLAQTERDLELIVVDDASTDASVTIVERIARLDPRVRLVRQAERGGPGAARNAGLAIARGFWIAVVDSDDLLHPERFERLLAAAGGSDLVADNMVLFDDSGSAPPRLLLPPHHPLRDATVSAEAYIRSNRLDAGGPALGYLKPIIRRATLDRLGIAYDPTLPIAEDYDLVVRLLVGGAVFRVIPAPTYFYRRHRASTSHRLTRATLEPMLAADASLRAALPAETASALHHALRQRNDSIRRAIRLADLVAAVKARRWRTAAASIGRHPGGAIALFASLLDRIRRTLAVTRAPGPTNGARRAVVVTRQRVTGANNGSSAYLIALCRDLVAEGYEVSLLCPSPRTFGRWPLLRLGPELGLFETVRFRKSLRLANLVFTLEPGPLLSAVLTIADRFGARLGLSSGRNVAPAPYAVALPWTDPDLLFVARHGRGASLIVADYAFQTEAIPYCLSPGARSIVVMHDVFSNMRSDGAVVSIDRREEMSMLDRADAVVAIQPAEAALVQLHLPRKQIAVVPMSTGTPDAAGPCDGPGTARAAQAQPGTGDRLLFVASNTAPNADGLAWFLAEIWPAIREAVPAARFDVVGSVVPPDGVRPAGVRFHGRVAALDPWYRDAAVVVSPLRTGTGLKIKLVEALGHGKAIVGTSVTLQGVEDAVGDAISCADSAEAFARAVASLLADPALRARRGTAALEVARRSFSPERGREALRGALRPRPDPAHPAAVDAPPVPHLEPQSSSARVLQ